MVTKRDNCVLRMMTIIIHYNLNDVLFLKSGDSLDKPGKAHKGRGRGISRGREKGQAMSPNGRGTPLGG